MWDKKLNLEEWDKIFMKEIKDFEIVREYNELKSKAVLKRTKLGLIYNSILLTQLWNGARISEAVEAIIKFKNNKNREQLIRARKRKDKKERKIKIPKSVKISNLLGLEDKTEKQLRTGSTLWAFNHHKINTHSLRYAWVAYMGLKKVPANIVSGMMRHTNVGMIARYTREDQADDMLMEMIK